MRFVLADYLRRGARARARVARFSDLRHVYDGDDPRTVLGGLEVLRLATWVRE
jgi:hypothetical protein